MSFQGKVVLVTGASSPVGTATALMFASLGANLSLCGKSEESLKKTAEKCEKLTAVKPLVIISDLTNEEDTSSLVHSTITYFLTLDVLVNNASILETGSIDNTSLQQFDKIFNINVRSVYHLTMLAVPYLIKSRGTIVNVSSVIGFRAFPGFLSYSMSKAAIDQFTRCLALELSVEKVRVNSVNIGVVITDLQKIEQQDETYKRHLERSRHTHPLGRAAYPEEIAQAIVFLASEKSSFVTGVNFPVDGGHHVTCSS